MNSFEFKLIQKELFREIEDFPKYSTAFAILLDAFAGEVVAWKWSDISLKKESYLSIVLKVDIPNAMNKAKKLMGHSDIATTQKYYIKIDLDKENSLQYLESL